MKKHILFFLFFLIYNHSFSQTIDSTWCGMSSGSIALIDSSFSMCDSSSNFNVIIESTVNNLWQKGKTTKFGTSNTRDTSCAIMTDTLNSYSTNNTSAFHFNLPTRYSGDPYYNYYLKFWHKFDTDSLLDGCWLEFSDDTGNTWHRIDSLNGWGWSNQFFQNGFNCCNVYNNSIQSSFQSFDTLLNGHKGWSGNSNGWRHTALWLTLALPIKPNRSNPINAVRFVFQSDSIQTNKSGWIIDELNIGYVIGPGGIENLISSKQLPIYPNPSSSGVFTISYPTNFVKGTMEVYTIHGQKLISTALNKQLDLSKYSKGCYHYKITFDTSTYSGMLIKE
jgi:hypothetical protein